MPSTHTRAATYLFLSTLAVGSALAACGDDETSSTDNASTTSAGGSTSSSANGGSSSTGGATSTGGSSSTSGGGGAYTYTPPDLKGQLFVGHYLGSSQIRGLNVSDFSPLPNSPAGGDKVGDILPISKLNYLVSTSEGDDVIHVHDATTLAEVAGSPFPSCHLPTALAHDDRTNRLFVACIGVEGQPSQSEISVYDTGSLPFTQLAGSPMFIDVATFDIAVDPVTSTLFGVNLSSAFAVSFDGTSFTHMAGSPFSLDGSGSDIAIDPERRRVFVADRRSQNQQYVHSFNLDTFVPETDSPAIVDGGFAGDLALHPGTGDLFFVTYGNAELHHLSGTPLTVSDTCGKNGCKIPPTETGLALDYESNRLFIPHVPSLNNPDDGPGFLTAWDVSTPSMPVETTMQGMRPALGVYPIRAAMH